MTDYDKAFIAGMVAASLIWLFSKILKWAVWESDNE